VVDGDTERLMPCCPPLVTVRAVEIPTFAPPHRTPTLYVPGGVDDGTVKLT
jgi:hypothetical protein